MSSVAERRTEAATAAILNARGMRRGMPPVANVLEMVPADILENATEDAAAALKAADAITAEALAAVEEADAQLAEEAKRLGLGATGDYPEGKLGPGDEGGLRAALAVAGGRVVLHFGKSLAWLAMTPDEADAFADGLKRQAAKFRLTN